MRAIRCACGRTYQPKPEHAGRSIRCKCGHFLPIPGSAGHLAGSGVLGRLLRRWTPWACWGWLIAVAVFALLFWWLADAHWTATLILYGPRWPLLVPVPVLLVAAAVVDRRLLVPILVGVLVVLGPVMGGRTGWRSLFGVPEGTPLRIVTFNMRGGHNPLWQEVVPRLVGLNPDLILIQECDETIGSPGLLPLGWVFRRDTNLCLLSPHPVGVVQTIDVVRTQEDGMFGLAAVYSVPLDGGNVLVGNVHLETPRRGIERFRWGGEVGGMSLNTVLRDAGSSRVSGWLTRELQVGIIAGDFNMPVESRIYRRHWSGCANAFSRRGRGFGYTRVLPKWSARIDHVLVCDPRWTVSRAFVGGDIGSDHLPVVVDLVLARHPQDLSDAP
ncbi:MAG TPA: endonuclease/exonuclease/phosphatase family protein [Gemmatimonadales bacterium]|nr:endonuclease/exonuclease/phosphatase family protein [Gemmatimonadales bacterium]